MTAPTLGARYLNACAALGVEPWREGMKLCGQRGRVVEVHHDDADLTCAQHGRMPEAHLCASVPIGGEVPDLSDPATMGTALAVYDEVRGRSAPDPVYLAATVYGLTAPETQRALVEALERIAAERGAGAGGAP